MAVEQLEFLRRLAADAQSGQGRWAKIWITTNNNSNKRGKMRKVYDRN